MRGSSSFGLLVIMRCARDSQGSDDDDEVNRVEEK